MKKTYNIDDSNAWKPAIVEKDHSFYNWPFKPMKGFIWLKDYLFRPIQIFHTVLALFVWFFLTPDLSKMQIFSWDWILFLYLRNVALLFLVTGSIHIWLYVKKGQLDKFRSNFGFGVSAFTPEALDLAVPDTTDRPYASTLFIRTGRVYGSANSPWMLETSLTFDILGLHIAEFVQTAIHSGQRINDPDARPNPQGWDQQVSNGFGLSASYEATAYRPLLRAFNESGTPVKRWVTPYWGGGVSLGTYTRARGTLGLVIGRAPDTDGQSIPSMFSLDIGRAERDNAKKDEVGGVNYDSYEIGKCKKGDFQVFFDAKAHLNVWGYNALLQGLPWSDDPYTLSGSDIERLTILWNANLHIIFRTTYLRGGLGARTREFKRSGGMPHGWGTLAFGWIL